MRISSTGRSWPCRRTFPIVGALLAAVAPSGLAVVHHAAGMEAAATYGYLTAYALVSFVVLGFILGRAEDRLRAMSITDPLTGLPNRRHLEARLREEVARCARSGAPLALLLIDVDGLKQVNDRGGHAAGDAALRLVAEALLRTCRRATDLPARVGGDEFAVLAPSTNARQALVLAERLRRVLRRLDAAAPTVSIGAADLDRIGSWDASALLRAADSALYVAKESGRDRAVASRFHHTLSFRRMEVTDGRACTHPGPG